MQKFLQSYCIDLPYYSLFSARALNLAVILYRTPQIPEKAII